MWKNRRLFAIKCISQSRSTEQLCQQIAKIVNQNAVVWCPHIMMLCDFIEEDCFFVEADMFRAIWKEKVFWRNDGLGL